MAAKTTAPTKRSVVTYNDVKKATLEKRGTVLQAHNLYKALSDHASENNKKLTYDYVYKLLYPERVKIPGVGPVNTRILMYLVSKVA